MGIGTVKAQELLAAINIQPMSLTEEQLAKLADIIGRLGIDRERWAKQNFEIEQTLAQAIGTYPWYANDLKNFPGSTKTDGVCTGEEVVEDVVLLAAKTIKELMAARYRFALTVKQHMLEFKDGSVYCAYCGDKLSEDHGMDCIVPFANKAIEETQTWLLNQNPKPTNSPGPLTSTP